MKRLFPLVTLVLASLVFPLTVDEILDKMEANQKPKSMRAEMTQTSTNASGKKRVSKLISYGKDGSDKGIMEYVSPAAIKGMKMLSLNDGDDIWVFFPRTNRVRKIASHQKNSSLNNSDFSYADMSNDDNREDFHTKLLGEGEKGGRPCYHIEFTAKEKDEDYQKMILWVDKETFVGLWGEFYDDDLKLWKVFSASEPKKIGEYWTADSIEMKNVQKGSRTVMTYQKIEFDLEVSDKMFSERGLKR